METVRLGPGNDARALELFRAMAAVFDEGCGELPVDYVQRLLSRGDLWILAAIDGGVVLGGVTAHGLPMTRSQSTELFIYDLAVSVPHQRRGIGRALVGALLARARQAGIETTFVPADDDDTHALDPSFEYVRADSGHGRRSARGGGGWAWLRGGRMFARRRRNEALPRLAFVGVVARAVGTCHQTASL